MQSAAQIRMDAKPILLLHAIYDLWRLRLASTILVVVGNICLLRLLLPFVSPPSGREYMAVAETTRTVPTVNCAFGLKSNSIAETTQDTMMENDAANVFSTLSAYLTTTATMRPPAACTITTSQTSEV